jgi:hypothetical protein
VTLGDIALLRAQSGDVAEALKRHKEKLGVGRDLGDIDLIANAQFDLARIDLMEERISEARARLAESWEINLRLGRADGIAFVGSLYGRLLLSTDPAQASNILRTARDAFQLLGWAQEVAELDALLATAEQA